MIAHVFLHFRLLWYTPIMCYTEAVDKRRRVQQIISQTPSEQVALREEAARRGIAISEVVRDALRRVGVLDEGQTIAADKG